MLKDANVGKKGRRTKEKGLMKICKEKGLT